MNKQKFIDLLISTEKVTETDFSALEQITGLYPFFQGGHTVLAKASRILKSGASPKKLATAAIYSTNRNLFKQYMVSGIKPTVSNITASQSNVKTTDATSQATRKAPELLSDNEQSELINDLYKNLEEWKSSRDQYLEFDKAHPEDIIIEEFHHEENHVEALKSQVAQEVEAEDDLRIEKPDKEEKKSEAEILDELKTQVAKEALKEEVEELEKELSKPKNVSDETPTDKPEDSEPIDGNTSESVYSFNKPIPEPQSLPETPKEKLIDQLPEPEDLPEIQEEELVNQLPEIEADDLLNTEEEPKSVDTSLAESENQTSEVEVKEEIQNSEEETISSTPSDTNVETTSNPKKEKDAPEIEDLDTNNQDLISTEELSAIVDQISDDVEESDSEEKTVIEDLSESDSSDLESQIDSMSVSAEPDSEEKIIEHVEEIETPENSNETSEEIEDDPSGLSQKVDLEDVKKLDPEEVFDADFSDEDIDFGSSNKKAPVEAEVESKKNVNKAESLESLSPEEFESFEIEPSLEDVSAEINKAPDHNKSEQALGDIDKEKKNLQLLPGASKGEKKFRLSVMKRPHNFTKPKKVLNARETREAKNKKEAEKPQKTEISSKKEDAVIEKKSATTRKKTISAKKAESKNPEKEASKPTKTTTRKTKAKKETAASKTEKKPKTAVKKTKSKQKEEEKENDTKSVKKKTITNKKTDEVLDHKSIIDSFIETNPSIKINKEAPVDIDNTVDLTIDSSEFPKELITENLATILKNQGKIDRAIEIYEKLILNNPKKKAYFASQIEKLKKN